MYVNFGTHFGFVKRYYIHSVVGNLLDVKWRASISDFSSFLHANNDQHTVRYKTAQSKKGKVARVLRTCIANAMSPFS